MAKLGGKNGGTNRLYSIDHSEFFFNLHNPNRPQTDTLFKTLKGEMVTTVNQ